MFWESVKLALRSVRRNILRSILTLLGIVIGVGAVIALVTIGNGVTQKITSDISKLGSNMLIVRSGADGPGMPGSSDARSLSQTDLDGLRRGLTQVRAVAPFATKQSNVVFETQSASVSVSGADETYFVAQDWTISKGRIFNESDVRAASNVCVIGATVVKNVMSNLDPVGQTLRIGDMPCQVLGVLTPKGQSTFGSDQDNVILMPLRTFQRRIAGNTKIGTIYVSANTAEAIAPTQATITEILRETRHIGQNKIDDFTVRDLTQLAATLSSTSVILTGLLSAVAGVSLLVGGIGIMNIMLVSVTERTREIGIRLAIGALASQVLMQFLVEAIVLCLIGGLIGIIFGLSLALLASSLLEFPFAIDLKVVALSFCFSGLIGLVFGFFPARNAAKLDPIVALRHE